MPSATTDLEQFEGRHVVDRVGYTAKARSFNLVSEGSVVEATTRTGAIWFGHFSTMSATVAL